ncbi:MAG: type II secretion system protein GspD [Acidisphaera sp.]|nr:type II secretion system protein GspD [Acidisphaera sp.]
MPVTSQDRITGMRTPFAPIAAAVVLLIGLQAPAAAQDASAIPWKPGVTFTRTSVDDDVRSVLRALLGADGLSVIFRPGVDGKISFNFRDMTLEAAFNQLIQENGLAASFNAATRTVTISPAGGGQGALHHFVTLQNVDWPSLRQMLISFGIGTEGIAFDPATSVLGITGDAPRIAQIEDLIKTLEEHYGEQREQALNDRQRSASAQRSDFERQAYQDAMNVQTKVFRLRFADVGPTTRNFHGRTVTIPGILETLQAMLGTNTPAAPPFATQSPEANPIHSAVPVQQLLQGAGSTGGRGTGGGSAGAAPPPAAAPGLAQAIGRPNISIDQRTNSVIVRGSPAAIDTVAEVLRQIDQPVKMVEIEVIIATAEIGVVNQLGLAYRGIASTGVGFDTGTSGGQLGSTSNVTALPGYNALTLLPSGAAGGTVASFVLGGHGFSVQAQLQALAEENKARVLSAPHLVTLDNVTARITRSEDIYVPVDTGGLNGQGLSQIQTGLTLEITPSIVPTAPGSPEQLVRLTLDATNSAPGSGTGNQINVNSQEVQTDVLVPDGGTFVIGGLFDDSRLKGTSGIPVLKNIPLIGQLFRTDSRQQSLGQTIFFITPRVVEQQELVSRDVALGDTAGYMDAQRRRLAGLNREMSDVPLRASAALEEDQ